MRNKDKLLYGRNNKLKPTPEEIIAYRYAHGNESLPKNYFDSFKKIPLSMHIKNYIGLAYLQALPFIRQTGFLFPIFILISIFSLFRKGFVGTEKYWMPLIFYLAFVNCLCLTPIVHLEFRWFMMFTILISVFGIIYLFQSFNKYQNITSFILYFNFLIIGILNALYIGIW
jgi:hypothetical protein